jgi:hypothetical protein
MMVHPQKINLRLNLVDSYQGIVLAYISQWGDLDT